MHLCRRCSILWPTCFIGIVALLVLGRPVADAPVIIAWLFLPVLEFVAVHTGKIAYRSKRVWLFGFVAGIGAARLFHRYLLNPDDPVVWAIALGFGLPAALAAVYHEMGKKPKVL